MRRFWMVPVPLVLAVHLVTCCTLQTMEAPRRPESFHVSREGTGKRKITGLGYVDQVIQTSSSADAAYSFPENVSFNLPSFQRKHGLFFHKLLHVFWWQPKICDGSSGSRILFAKELVCDMLVQVRSMTTPAAPFFFFSDLSTKHSKTFKLLCLPSLQ